MIDNNVPIPTTAALPSPVQSNTSRQEFMRDISSRFPVDIKACHAGSCLVISVDSPVNKAIILVDPGLPDDIFKLKIIEHLTSYIRLIAVRTVLKAA